MIYLDNAATTMHKPQAVIDAVTQAMCSLGNAGRGARRVPRRGACHPRLSRQACALAGLPRADHVCFTPNSTTALNTVINGVVRPGDRVVTTVLEHNSVLRPLNRLAAEQGVTVEHAGCDANGVLDYDELERLVTPGTRAVVVTHASNVTGNAVDIARVAAMAHAAGALVIVDASQSAGTAHIDMRAMGLDVVCFTGTRGSWDLKARVAWPWRRALTWLLGPWAARACTASMRCSRGSGPRALRRARSTVTVSPAFLPASTLSRPRVGSRRLLPTSVRSLIASLPVYARFQGLSSTVRLTCPHARRSSRSTWAISILRDFGCAHARVGDCDAPRCSLRSAHAPRVGDRAPGCRSLLVWVFQHGRGS